MIEDFARLIPESLMDKSGSVFYSGRRAFGSSSKLYILGMNPAGDLQTHSDLTVSWHTDKVLHKESENWSSYRDEKWAKKDGWYVPGAAPMQKRMLHLFQRIGSDPGEVPASNIIFLRFGRQDQPERYQISQLAQKCWNFHEAVVERLGVRVVVCLGNESGDLVRGQIGAHTQIDEFIENNRRNWQSSTHIAADSLSVVTLTHPSVADWTSPTTDPTHLVQRALSR